MVSFFGLKFGGDKRKERKGAADSTQPLAPPLRRPERPATPGAEDIAAWRILRENELRASINRPRTAQGGFATGRSSPAPGSLSDLRDSAYIGVSASFVPRPGTASPAPGLAPDYSLRPSRSEANLKVTLGGARNLSSSSLAMPPRRFDSPLTSDAGPRPGTAHSMRRFADQPPPVLHLNLANASTASLGGPPQRSPLGQFELESPVKSDSESLLGDEPDRIADGIKARLAREEEDAAKAKAAEQERRWAQAQMAAQKQRRANAEGPAVPRMAYPSPPSSIEGGEHEVPTLSMPVPRPGPRSPAPFQQGAPRPAGRGNGPGVRPTGHHVPPPRAPTFSVDGDGASGRGGRPPVAEGRPVPSQRAQQTQDSSSTTMTATDGGSTEGNSTSGAQLLRPEDSKDPMRCANAPAQATGKIAPRSPLFQQMSPFDVHSEEEEDDDDHHHHHGGAAQPPAVDHRAAANAPYGIPSPPLSHRTRPSDEDEGLPVLRTVEAKRDTMVVGGPGRESLGLQIEEFEKSLQQAQAMSALEKGSDAVVLTAADVMDVRIATTRASRAGSNGSSNYSDMSESPMTMEPPLVSPKPFPLSPRPISPGDRLRATAAEAAPCPPAPALEVRPDSPFGSVRQRTAAIQAMRRKGSEDRPLRPRVGAATPRRPTLGEYGGVKVNTVASLAGRVRRPSPDEYGIQIKPADTPVRTASPFSRMDAPCDKESPILKDLRPLMTFESPSEARSEYTDSAVTSRASSPISSGTGSGSYSVFSPPQPAAARRHVQPPPQPQSQSQPQPQPPPPSRSVQAEWQFGPAPTAPPTSPLPIPERSAARKKSTLELAAQRGRHEGPTPLPAPPPPSPGLASSASIVPDPDANPNWPLPGPGGPPSPFQAPSDADADAASASASAAGSDGDGTGFAARRALLRAGGRSPPALAPLNIAAARYADEIDSLGGPWTPGPPVAAAAAAAALDGEDKSAAIGVARGLSIKYDRARDADRRGARSRERTRLGAGAASTPAWRLEEEEEEEGEKGGDATSAPIMASVLSASPTAMAATTGEPFDRLRRPNHGLKSPTGIADEQGIRFI